MCSAANRLTTAWSVACGRSRAERGWGRPAAYRGCGAAGEGDERPADVCGWGRPAAYRGCGGGGEGMSARRGVHGLRG